MSKKILIIGFLLLLFPTVSLAAVTLPSDLRPPGAPTLTGDTPEKQADVFTARVVNFILGFAGIVAIFFIVNNAWFLIASGGSEETITQHKKGLMWAVVGLILIILSYSIISFIIEIPFKADQPALGGPDASPVGTGEGSSFPEGTAGA